MWRTWPLVVLLVVLVAAPAASAEPAPPGPGQTTRLSNETTRSHWAYVATRVWARRAPGKRARRVKRLLTYVRGTGSPELVLALREHRLPDGRLWVQVRLPMRPNNRTGWVPREALERLRLVRTQLVIHTGRIRATLFRGGRRVWAARVGVGTRRWPTPRGRFYIRERLSIPRGPGRELYGPFALGTSALSATLSGGNWGEGVVGVHGTGHPELIPGRISHGCVRVRNRRIRRLWRLAPLGTPVRITR
jgi:lipoprotein-anchoring transpeptidase ErfK/SrfK